MDNTNNQTNASSKTNSFFSRNSRKKKKRRRITRNELTSYVFSLLISLVSIGLSIYYSNYAPEGENKVIQCTKEDGKYQKRLQEMPSVVQFMKFLRYIEQKDTTKIWESAFDNKRKKWGEKDKMGIVYDYFLTHNYKLNYIIPVTESSFYVWIEFTDLVDVKDVVSLKTFRSTKLKDICEKRIPEELVDEVYKYLDDRFLVESDYTEDSLKNYIRNYMYDMSMNNYLAYDWRFPILIAQKLQLKPGAPYGSYTELQHSQMLSFVEMVEDSTDGQWRVKTFDTKLITRWQ